MGFREDLTELTRCCKLLRAILSRRTGREAKMVDPKDFLWKCLKCKRDFFDMDMEEGQVVTWQKGERSVDYFDACPHCGSAEMEEIEG
jgi:hypothetical protein|tara:strand:- start:1868 stop:2131 length:264 start_codon:yes stop_codon:yes gene_type:complete